jgi:hypothetical protein
MTILLMTATVTPPPTATKLARMDPVLRLRDYEEALRFYLGKLDSGLFESIVFVDNSNSDVSSLRRLAAGSGHKDRVEFIGFDGLDYPPENGRGYGEMSLIDFAMANSHEIRRAAPGAMVWKVTGRYIVKNVDVLVQNNSGALCCHCRNLPQPWADMYLMGWIKEAYSPLLGGVAERIKESATVSGSAESHFRRFVDEKSKIFNIVRRFKNTPQIIGIRGWDNRNYSERNFAKDFIRGTTAVLAPWVWL